VNVTHAIQGIEDGVLAHECREIVLVREDIGAVAGVPLEFSENSIRLFRQSHDMGPASACNYPHINDKIGVYGNVQELDAARDE